VVEFAVCLRMPNRGLDHRRRWSLTRWVSRIRPTLRVFLNGRPDCRRKIE
jgi:hypothetical protein